MRILFTADIHIKTKIKNVPDSWNQNRFQLFLSKVEDIKCDIHVLGGDVFDKLPNLDELGMFFNMVSKTKHKTLIYPGNHEATNKGQTFLSKLAPIITKLNPLVTVIDKAGVYEECLQILPYNELWDIENKIKLFDINKPLWSHFRASIPPHVIPEIDLNLVRPFKLVIAGDLHSHSNSQENIVYPGSPYNTHFSRQETLGNGYLLVDSTDWSWKWHSFDLPKLLRKTISSPSEAIPTSPDFTIYELEGSIKDLSSANTNELIGSKKLTSNKKEISSILNKDMSISEEFYVYARDILKINNIKEVQEVLLGIIQNS